MIRDDRISELLLAQGQDFFLESLHALSKRFTFPLVVFSRAKQRNRFPLAHLLEGRLLEHMLLLG